MKWLTPPTDPRRLMAVARLQNSLDFKAGWRDLLEEYQTELSLHSASIIDDREYRQNQGRLQVVMDLLSLCRNAHDWATATQAKTKKP